MTIYLDENMPRHLAEGFQIIQFPEGLKTFNHQVEVKYLPSDIGIGAKDVDWLPIIGNDRHCIITQDINLSKRKNEVALYKQHKVGIFFLRGKSKKQGLGIWEMTQALARNWPEICKIAHETERPFGYKFHPTRKMEEMEL